MTITNALAGIAVDDFSGSLPWYELLFGRTADSRPLGDVAEWKLPTDGWIQVITDADRAGASTLTLIVDDLAGELHRLKSVGIEPVAKSMGDFFKTAKLRDPDGNQIVLSEPRPGTY